MDSTVKPQPKYADVLAPWLGSRNLGDLVIRDSLMPALAKIGLLCNSIRATQYAPSSSFAHAETGLPLIVAGSNLLPFRSRRDDQFPLTATEIRRMEGRAVLLGVGWRRYSSAWDKDSIQTTKSSLSQLLPHSVRDSYTKTRLEELGIDATLTGCPSLWSIPTTVGEFDSSTAVVTITDYSSSRIRDMSMLKWVRANFREVWLQPLGVYDVDIAIKKYDWNPDQVLAPSLSGYSRFLTERRPVYVGTRLHGGVRALQLGLPSVIVGVDHRAVEMGRDFGLRVSQGDLSDIDTLLAESISSMPSELQRARDAGASYMSNLHAAIELSDHECADCLEQERLKRQLVSRGVRKGTRVARQMLGRVS